MVKTLVKTITIREEVYRKLLAIKEEGESFSELFERLLKNVNSIETLKKLRGCVEFRERLLFKIKASRAERRI